MIAAVEASDTYVDGTLNRNGDFFTWETTEGVVCGYSPRLRAEVRASAIEGADPEDYAGIDTVSYATKGGSPSATKVSVFQPYYGIDSSFSTQYATEGSNIAKATGGTSTTYKTTNATIDAIADALETSAVVVFDSHGDTDYYSGDDYTSRANTSYLCLQSGTGLTTADQASVTGTYGSYYHAYYAGANGSMKYYCVDGTAIANHMESNACNNLLWMAICLGMATDGLNAPLHSKGVEVVYGYSQSVSFDGDYEYEESFWDSMIDGKTVAEAVSTMKSSLACWDPAYNYSSITTAKKNYAAFPIVVSSEDTYPGHGNVDNYQTVKSTWTLFSQHTVSATSNNTAYGTVSVSGSTITASPKDGYYAAGYTVTSGTATISQNGNTFAVSASSDCSVQINFAAKTAVTVSFSGADGVSPVSGYAGDAMTLPIATAPEGYTFLGWMESSVDEPDRATIPVKLIREACAELYVRPNEGNRKIYLFPRAAALRAEAQNALLKCIEEPPPYGAFVFLCEHAEQMLPTVRSRCVELRLSPLEDSVLLSELRRRYPEKDASLLTSAAVRSGGYLGWAIAAVESGESLLPQSESFVQAYCAGDRAALLRLLVSMEKLKREQLRPIFAQWIVLLEGALRIHASLPGAWPASERIAAVRTSASLLAAVAAVEQAQNYLESNVGAAHLCGALAVRLQG